MIENYQKFLIALMVKISKIKILLYSSEYWPFYDLIQVISKNGMQVDVYVYEQKNSPFKYLYELLNLKKTNFKNMISYMLFLELPHLLLTFKKCSSRNNFLW